MQKIESKYAHNEMSKILEHKLNLKQLQLNGLLNITQAINDNIKVSGLFQMYAKFLTWELGVSKMALFIPEDLGWNCKAEVNAQKETFNDSMISKMHAYTRLSKLDKEEHLGLNQFDIIIPVHHKEVPIAYALIGEMEDSEEYYSKVQFITTITNIIAVAIENKRLFKRQLEQERLNREMELASDVQKMLIPRLLPNNKYFELASFYQPQIGVGGDYFDCILNSENSLVICIGDISGKGIAAAMLMSNFQASLHVLIQRDPDLETLVKELNAAVFRTSQGDRYITFFIARIDADKKTVEFINAGHVPPLAKIDGHIIELSTGSTILGGFEEIPFLEKGFFTYENECILLCYTDGITDLLNNRGDYFSDKNVIDFFIDQKNHTPIQMVENLKAELEVFKEEQEFTDDMTVLVCKVCNGKKDEK